MFVAPSKDLARAATLAATQRLSEQPAGLTVLRLGWASRTLLLNGILGKEAVHLPSLRSAQQSCSEHAQRAPPPSPCSGCVLTASGWRAEPPSHRRSLNTARRSLRAHAKRMDSCIPISRAVLCIACLQTLCRLGEAEEGLPDGMPGQATGPCRHRRRAALQGPAAGRRCRRRQPAQRAQQAQQQGQHPGHCC